MAKIVQVNVGGQVYQTSVATLRRATYFQELLDASERLDKLYLDRPKPVEIWVDRDGHTFRKVLNVLRGMPVSSSDKELKAELDFYGYYYYGSQTESTPTIPEQTTVVAQQNVAGVSRGLAQQNVAGVSRGLAQKNAAGVSQGLVHESTPAVLPIEVVPATAATQSLSVGLDLSEARCANSPTVVPPKTLLPLLPLLHPKPDGVALVKFLLSSQKYNPATYRVPVLVQNVEVPQPSNHGEDMRFWLPVCLGHIRRIWIQFRLREKGSGRLLALQEAIRQEEFFDLFERVTRERGTSSQDAFSGSALRHLHLLAGSSTGQGLNDTLLQRAQLETDHVILLELPLLRDIDPSISRVEEAPGWKENWQSHTVVSVKWRPNPKWTVEEPRVRVDYAISLLDGDRPDRLLAYRFPVEQWQDPGPFKAKPCCIGDQKIEWEVQLPFNHRIRKLIWSVKVQSTRQRVKCCRLQDSARPARAILFDLDEIHLLTHMADNGLCPIEPVYAFNFGDCGVQVSKVEDPRLVLELPGVPFDAKVVCEIQAISENTLVLTKDAEFIQFSS
jgi:hypothetical protein